MRVLIATDGSIHAENAAALFARLPHSETLQLTILAVSASFEVHGSREVVDWLEQNAATETARTQEWCDRIVKIFDGADAQIETVTVKGHAGNAIVAQSEERNSELIVLGSVGHSAVDRILLGSVSDFVATHAKCSVLVARPFVQTLEELSPLRVCIGYDNSPQSQIVLQEIGRFAWGPHTELSLVNAFSIPINYSEIPVEIDTTALQQSLQETVDHAAEQLRTLSPNVAAEVIETSHIGDGIVRFADDHGAHIIALGDTGHGLLTKFLLGSVSKYVLRHSNRCVWIMRKTK